MASKTWTANDLKQGALKILPRNDGTLHVERRYRFIDEAGEILEQVIGGRVVEDVVLAELPAIIINALTIIDDWTKQKALEQEGMMDK